MISTVRGSRPAFFMHAIRSLHVNGTGVPVREYHCVSTAMTKALFEEQCWLRRFCTTKGLRSSRFAKLSQLVTGFRAIKPEMDWLLSHGLSIIRSDQVMPPAGIDQNIHNYVKKKLNRVKLL